MPELPSDTCRITGTVIGIGGTYFTLELRDGSKVHTLAVTVECVVPEIN